MKIICGPCALKNEWSLEDRISMARLRKLDVRYNCDECDTEHVWTFNRKSEFVDNNINNTEEILIQTSLF
jgi:hypothetical protein